MRRFLWQHFAPAPRGFTYVFAIILSFFISVLACRGQNNIVDLYRELPTQYLSNYRYEIFSKDGNWYSYSISGYKFSISVDLSGNFLHIEDPGGTGESFSQELRIFEITDGTPLLAVNIKYFDGVGAEGSLAIYYKTENTWKEWITNEMKSGLPELGYQNFMTENYLISDEAKEEEALRCIQVLYKLPEKGTTVIAIPGESRLDYKIETAKSENERKFYTNLQKNIKYGEIELLFDNSAGIFTVGQKKLKQ